MAQLERLKYEILGEFISTGFDHQDGIGGAGHAQVEGAGRHLRDGWVDDELAVDETHTHRADRTFPRDIRDHNRRAGANDAQDVQVDLGITRERGHDNLHLVHHPLREERAQGAIDQTANQDRLVAGPALTALEAAGDTAGGVEAFLIVHAEREEIHALRGLEPQTVANSTESPERTLTAPPASLAKVPVSMMMSRSPTLVV